MMVAKSEVEATGTVLHDCPVLLPHQMSAYLYESNQPRFQTLFLNGQQDPTVLEAFWSGVVERRDPRIRYHEMCTHPEWRRHAVPLSMHGDVVPCISIGCVGSKSFDVYSWQGLLSLGHTMAVKLYLFGLFEMNKVVEEGASTMTEIFRLCTWSLKALQSGLWPSHNHLGAPLHDSRAGIPLAGGYFGVLWSLKADLDHFPTAYGLHHYASNQPCNFCHAYRCDVMGHALHTLPQ